MRATRWRSAFSSLPCWSGCATTRTAASLSTRCCTAPSARASPTAPKTARCAHHSALIVNLEVLLPKRQASGQVHNMRACMHWMPRHTHTFPFFLKSLQLFFGDSGVHVHVYRRICTVTVPFSLIPHPFSYKSPLISHSFTASTHFLPRDARPSRGRPDTSDMFPASIATTRLPESTPVCARASKMSRRWSGGMPDGRAEWQGLGFRV